MGIRNKITTKGFFSEKIAGSTVELDKSAVTETTTPRMGIDSIQTGSTWVSQSAPVVLMYGGSAANGAATASLPPITADTVGKLFWLFATSGTLAQAPFVTSSNPINNGAWTRTLSPGLASGSVPTTSAFQIVTFIAYSSSIAFSAGLGGGNFGWAAASGSAL